MASQQLPKMGNSGVERQPVGAESENLDQEESDDLDDSIELYEPEPELPVSDASRDQAVLLIVALVGLGVLVILLGLNFLSVTGIFGSGCGPIPTNRTGQCYQQRYTAVPYGDYTPTSAWLRGVFTSTVTPDTVTPSPR